VLNSYCLILLLYLTKPTKSGMWAKQRYMHENLKSTQIIDAYNYINCYHRPDHKIEEHAQQGQKIIHFFNSTKFGRIVV